MLDAGLPLNVTAAVVARLKPVLLLAITVPSVTVAPLMMPLVKEGAVVKMIWLAGVPSVVLPPLKLTRPPGARLKFPAIKASVPPLPGVVATVEQPEFTLIPATASLVAALEAPSTLNMPPDKLMLTLSPMRLALL